MTSLPDAITKERLDVIVEPDVRQGKGSTAEKGRALPTAAIGDGAICILHRSAPANFGRSTWLPESSTIQPDSTFDGETVPFWLLHPHVRVVANNQQFIDSAREVRSSSELPAIQYVSR